MKKLFEVEYKGEFAYENVIDKIGEWIFQREPEAEAKIIVEIVDENQ